MKSMTGFGCCVMSGEKGTIRIEIKAVNSRFLELNVKSNHISPLLEDEARKLIKERVCRGKLYVTLSFEPFTDGQEIHVSTDKNLLSSYLEALTTIRHMSDVKNKKITLSDLLLLPEPFLHVGIEPVSDNELQPLFREVVLNALQQLDDMRIKEGKNLEKDLRGRISFLLEKLDFLKSMQFKVLDDYKTRLKAKMIEICKTVDEKIDETRFLQEVALYADKTDFTEELVRFESHLKQFSDALNCTEPVGRRLDFILQEINREVNTTASKTNDIAVVDCVIIVKTELEKIREQVQNIE